MLLSLHASGQTGIRSCSPAVIVLSNGEELRSSFLLSPETTAQEWSVSEAAALNASDLAQVFAMQPDVFLLGTGTRQVFPEAAVMAQCLSRRIGIEVMDNAAAARTFNVLLSEGRNVVLGIILPGK
jgi:uncharacterized protein